MPTCFIFTYFLNKKSKSCVRVRSPNKIYYLFSYVFPVFIDDCYDKRETSFARVQCSLFGNRDKRKTSVHERFPYSFEYCSSKSSPTKSNNVNRVPHPFSMMRTQSIRFQVTYSPKDASRGHVQGK